MHARGKRGGRGRDQLAGFESGDTKGEAERKERRDSPSSIPNPSSFNKASILLRASVVRSATVPSTGDPTFPETKTREEEGEAMAEERKGGGGGVVEMTLMAGGEVERWAAMLLRGQNEE